MNFRELKGYGYRCCGIGKKTDTPFFREHIYTFQTTKKKNRYIVIVEQYPHSMFVMKFHLKAHTDAKLKYVIRTNLNDDARRIIETCIIIGHDIIKKYPLASFGFLGCPITDEVRRGKEEMLNSTKRYNLYLKFAVNYFNPENYLHHHDPKNSSYMLINTKVFKTNPKIVETLSKMFQQYYNLHDMFDEIMKELEKH